MVVVAEEARYVRHYKQKVAFECLLSGMRQFVEELRTEGITADDVPLGDPENTRGFTAELARIAARYYAGSVIVAKVPHKMTHSHDRSRKREQIGKN